jgi:hypothetical protein
MNYKEYATQLIQDWQLCVNAKPKHDAVDIQLEKDRCEEWAIQLMTISMWGSPRELAETCNQFESRLNALKEKIVIEVLKNGAV